MMTRTTQIAGRLKKHLATAYPQLTIRVTTATTDITIADDTQLEGTRASAYLVTFTASAGSFTEAIPTKDQTVTSAAALLKRYADDLASDEDREREAVREALRMTGADV